MEKTKYDSTKLVQLIKSKAKLKQIIDISELAKEIHLKENEVRDLISQTSLDIEHLNNKTNQYINQYFKPVLAHFQKNLLTVIYNNQ